MDAMRLLVTRPEPDAGREADALIALGHDPVRAPLLEIEFLSDVPLPLDDAQGVVITSRNTIRALANHPDVDQVLELPVFAVGEATAWAARQLGFREVTIGPGTGAGLPPLIRREVHRGKGPLVHIGAEKVAFDSHPVDTLTQEVVSELKSGAISGVLLMSPRTARTFTRLAQAEGLVPEAKGLVCYCLSKAIAEAVAPLGLPVRVPTYAREEDLLALLNSGASSS
jgi:uroporphyrinogen-III synthase